jgi:hypothetical protein
MYALTATAPHEMFPRLLRMCLTREEDRSAVWGTYTVQRTAVTVNAKQSWQYVRFELNIDREDTLHGRYGCLTFDSHATSPRGTYEDGDRIVYDVPEEPFRFIKDTRL